jgi:hypothetical protein
MHALTVHPAILPLWLRRLQTPALGSRRNACKGAAKGREDGGKGGFTTARHYIVVRIDFAHGDNTI